MKSTDLPDDRERVGATLRALRESQGTNVDTFANAMQISRPYLANIEAGRKRLTPVLLARAADLLGVPQMAIRRPQIADDRQAS